MVNIAPELVKYEIASVKRLMAVMRRRNKKKNRHRLSETSTGRRFARGDAHTCGEAAPPSVSVQKYP